MQITPFVRGLRAVALAALFGLSGWFQPDCSAQSVLLSELKLRISRGPGPTVILTWFGELGTQYQLETTEDLIAYSNLGLVVTGNGGEISVSRPLAGTSGLFRLKRLAPDPTTAVYNAATGTLTITGNEADNVITVSRDPSGIIRVNNGAVSITGGTPTVANTSLLEILGRDGHDQISLDETNGALPPGSLFGEGGNDTLTGGSGADELHGGPGDDTLSGKGGIDLLRGGDHNDVVTGGDGNDNVFGDGGNDRLVWNPGDDTDLNEGGSEIDTVEVNGGSAGEVFTTTANGTRVRFDRLDPAPFFLDINACENLVLNAGDGNDSSSATGNLQPLIAIRVDGGRGDDTLLGSNGNDVLIGGDDHDFIDGQQGTDTVLGGNGDDTFQWDPGDGNDILEGQAGVDTLLFNGSAGAEIFDVAANGGRVRFTRNLGNIVMDLDDVEQLTVNMLGSTDTITVNDLAGTDLTNITAQLAGTIGGTAGDGAVDAVIINGTSGDDIITAASPNGDLLVTGLAANVLVDGFEFTLDTVRINGLAGDDVIDASAVTATGPLFSADGGIGNDILLGGAGSDSLFGGDNDDILLGGAGADALDGGIGDNVVLQDSANFTTGIVTLLGDGLDNTMIVSRDAAGNLRLNGTLIPGATVANTSVIRVFGQAGNDTITFDQANGALPAGWIFGGAGTDVLTGGAGNDLLFGGSQNDTILGVGGFDFLFGGSNNDTLTGGDADDQVFGGADADRMIWNPGDDTDLNEGGAGSDIVEVNGGGGDEQFTTTANGTRVRFDRLNPAPFAIDIGTSESLVLNANGGNDSFSATGNLAALIQITVNGGAGDDTLLGSNGVDLLIGGDNNDFIDGQQGNDNLFGGAGNDTIQWDPGDGSDVVEGQDGSDTLLFNGSAGAELFDASANGGRVRFTRNLGTIVMDLDDVENLTVNMLGNTDTLTVNDLTGTDLTSINAELSGTIGGTAGDGAADNVIINATNADDIITATSPNGDLLVTGLAATLLVDGFESTLDTVRINGLGGDDIIDASAVEAAGPLLAEDGGPGNDILLGGAGTDTQFGGDDDDILLGGAGADALDGGVGDNTILQDSANFTTGIVTLLGDGLDNTMIVSRDAAGNLRLNGTLIPGATVANTSVIRVFGQAGNDTITFDQANGALPAGWIFGGAGTDVLTGGAGNDLLFGGSQNDTILGLGGFDSLFGGPNNDTLTGGDADDQVFGGADADRMIWNPGDDTDLNEGGAGSDIVEVNGGGGDEQFTTTANGTRVRFDRLNPAPFAIDIGTSESLVLNANGGNDSFSATGNLAALIQITVDGGTGDDTLLGSNGVDLLIGGDNNDFIDGQQGNDNLFGGAGNDTFQWDPGDGSDIVEGQAGNDTLLFNGSAGNETFTLSANGGRALFTRSLGLISMDLDDVENLQLNMLGGIDALTVHDLTGTDLTNVLAELAGAIGGTTGDAAVDTITLNGTPAADTVNITANAGAVEVAGLPAFVRIRRPEAANDDLIVNGLGGTDSITTGNGVSTLIQVIANP